ncbi:MAG TPA: cytochrome c biogenesis protein CcsA [Burkholderiaceae bacterium]|nr:cytochrome c biogenesis protein CcsA [Burkholderiaceae bacterium]
MILSSDPATGAGAAAAAATGWWLGLPSLIALAAYAATALLPERLAATLRALLLVGFAAQAVAIGVDISGAGSAVEAARFGFAPALSLTVWLVLAVYLVESRFVPLPGARRVLALLAIAVVALAWAFPGEVRPQVGWRWAPVHWALGLASYGLFGAAVLHAVMLNRAERQMRPSAGTIAAPPRGGMPLLRLERMTFRFVAAGFVVLSAALVLGASFAHPWRWDHKTVFSMLGWLVFAGLLAGRRAFGWRGPVATRGVYAGAGLLLLAYVGSRFVLEVLLHRAPG